MNLFTIALALLIGIGTKEESMSPATSRAATPPTSVNKNILLQLVNDVRRKGCQCGDTYYGPAPAISWNEQLAAAAYSHSEDMSKNKFFAHMAPDGSNGGARIQRTGYKWMAFGENIAMGYKSEKEVVEGWIESPGHCKNIMNKLYKEMGVGRYGSHWTQEFGTKR